MLELAVKICTDKELDEVETKDIILECMVTTLERVPSIINNNQKNGIQMMDKVIELILNHFITNLPREIKPTWCSPPEGKIFQNF